MAQVGIAMNGRVRIGTAAVLALALLTGCGKPAPETSPAEDTLLTYRELDPGTLASVPDDKLEEVVFDHALTRIGGDFEREAEILATLPPGVRALYLTWQVEGEVNNGGFNQYYWNTDDRFSEQAVEAFEFFSATEHASLMREANRVRAAEKEKMAEFKDRGTVEAFSESYKVTKLGQFDDRFFKMGENLSALRIAKIRAAPEMFSGK